MNRGVNRQTVFFGDDDRVEFGRRLADIHGRFGVETLAYCLLDNHYHVLLRTPDGALSEAMHRLGSLYTRHTNDRVGRDGPLFRGRFHSLHVTTDAYLLMATRYIHRNALEVHNVRSIADYRWSSYRAYTAQRMTPSFMRTDIVLDNFGGERADFAEFHLADDSLHESRIRPRSMSELKQLIQFVLADDDLHHGDDASPPPWRDRTLLVLLLTRPEGTSWLPELESELAFASADAKRMAISRAKKRRDTDPAIARAERALSRLLSRRPPAA
ncbi:MAG TPA: transposase [Ilumatobacter sp.]|nr:transposase [Ilumatobacter sp.]